MPTLTSAIAHGLVLAALLALPSMARAAEKKGESGMAMTISSPAFQSQGEIPQKYTCEGANVSPALEWSGVPSGARSLVLIVDDPDAPDPKAPKMVWVHWAVFDLPPNSKGLPEAVAANALPAPTREGLNDFKRQSYGGPCPPIGRHRYFFKLYALDTQLAISGKPTKADLEKAMKGHVLAEAQLVGTYEKKR